MLGLHAQKIALFAALGLAAVGCKKDEATTDQDPKAAGGEPTAAATETAANPEKPVEEAKPVEEKPTEAAATDNAGGAKAWFMDVHAPGPGKFTMKDIEAAHQKDLAAQGKHDVTFKRYWVSEKDGKVFCLAEAPTADAAVATHKEAHGGVADKIMKVVAGEPSPAKGGGMKVFMDTHEMGAGKVTAADVAKAHEKDLAVQEKHKVNFMEYWVDEETGTVFCLAEAPSADALIAAHKEAHGGVPQSVVEVTEGK